MVGNRLIAPPEEQGKANGILSDTQEQPRPLKRIDMQEELKEVADLLTANTIFCTKEVLTSEECARYLGVSKSALYKWTMTRQIPHYKSPTGKLVFFNRAEVEDWMQSTRVATDAELEQQAKKMAKKGGNK